MRSSGEMNDRHFLHLHDQKIKISANNRKKVRLVPGGRKPSPGGDHTTVWNG